MLKISATKLQVKRVLKKRNVMKSENFTHTLSTKLRPRASKILDRKLFGLIQQQEF